MKRMSDFQHLFIDESGKSELRNTSYKDFILTGVLIGNSELPIISGYFSFIKRKYKLAQNVPYHSYHLLEDPHSPYRLKTRQIPMFMESMKEFLQLIPLTIYIIHTDKDEFRRVHKISQTDLVGSQENKNRNGVLYYLSSLEMFSRVVRRLEILQAQCGIHTDSRKYLDAQLLKAFIDIKEQTFHARNGNQPNNTSDIASRLCSIEFANKTALSAGLELTDFVSYVVFASIRGQLKRLHVDRVWPCIQRKLVNKKLIGIKTSLSKLYI